MDELAINTKIKELDVTIKNLKDELHNKIKEQNNLERDLFNLHGQNL